jgi:hypothetical protein
MATHKLTYTLGDINNDDFKIWEYYVDNVVNENEAVAICNYKHPEIPKEAHAKIQLVFE